MYFDLYTVIAMMLIVLIALVGMSRSFIIVAHERILSALLNEPYDDMKYCTNKPILFRSAWGVIRNALANEDHDNYNSVDDVLAKVRKEITLDIQPGAHRIQLPDSLTDNILRLVATKFESQMERLLDEINTL